MEPLFIAILVFAVALAVNMASKKLFFRLVSALIMGWAAVAGGSEVSKATTTLHLTYKVHDLLKPIIEASDKGDCAQVSAKMHLFRKDLGYAMTDHKKYIALLDELMRDVRVDSVPKP